MSWESRTPPIQLIISKSLFNKLVGILEKNIKLNDNQEEFSSIANALKEKLLTYSVPRTYDNDTTQYVEIRFFHREASNMIWQLLAVAEYYLGTQDYYEILLKNRENKKSIN